MVNTLKQKLELSIYGYDPSEYMPIYRNGVLDNKGAFAWHKFTRVINKLQAGYERLSVS